MEKKKVKELLIIIIFILTVEFIFAQDISVNYPQNVYVGEEFNLGVSLINFTEGVCDIKVEILNGNHNICQRFWENEWKSTAYWMYNAINLSETSSKAFRLNITEDYEGTNNFTIKIKSEKFSKNFNGYLISINKRNITSQNPANNNSQDSSNNQNNNQNNNQDENSNSVSLSLSWQDEDIINGEEFNINVKAYNLKNKNYDVKVYIYDDDKNKPISEIYHSENNWVSSTRYYNEFFSGPGDKSDDIKLRIKESYKDFAGSAKIGARIRENSGSSYKELERDIDIIKAKEENKNKSTIDENQNKSVIKEYSKKSSKNLSETNSFRDVTGNVISLGKSESIKTSNNNLYESKNEKIKKYSVYFFIFIVALLTAILLILIVFRKFNYKQE